MGRLIKGPHNDCDDCCNRLGWVFCAAGGMLENSADAPIISVCSLHNDNKWPEFIGSLILAGMVILTFVLLAYAVIKYP